MERGIVMVFQSAVFSIVLYVFMIFGLGYNDNIAENRSILIGSCISVYMILFGYGLPVKLNKNI